MHSQMEGLNEDHWLTKYWLRHILCVHFQCLGQGSQTQIYRGPHLDGKSLSGPHFRVKRPLRAAMLKDMSYIVHNLLIFEHFLPFNDQNFFFCLFKRESRAALAPLAGHMRPAGRMFETPGLGDYLSCRRSAYSTEAIADKRASVTRSPREARKKWTIIHLFYFQSKTTTR